MKQRSANTYENLVAYYNRGYSPYYQCECGKYVQEKTRTKHEETTLHAYLMEYKIRCQKLKEEINSSSSKETPNKEEIFV